MSLCFHVLMPPCSHAHTHTHTHTHTHPPPTPQLRGAPPDGLAVVLEALWQLLPSCQSVADLMLEQVISEQKRRYELVLGGVATQEVGV
jgi:hypothetical protein